MAIQTINNGETLLSVREKINANFSELDSGKQSAMGADDNYVTDAEKTNIGNLDTAAYQPSSAFDASGSATTAENNAKAYADGLVVGLWDDRGNFDASVNAYPSSGGSGTAGAILKGDAWTVSVAGTLPTAQVVEIGDVVRALVNTPGNTQSNWAIQQNNIGYTAENSANKGTTMSGNTTSNIIYLSAKAVYDWAVALFAPIASPTFTGTASFENIQLGEASVKLDPALSADGKWSGITEAGTAGATLAFGDLCYFQASDSRWELVDANLSAGYDKKLGMCVLAAASDGSATEMLLIGKIRADANFPTLTIGSPVYMSETAGDIVVAQPTTADACIRVVGYANTADELWFNPSSDYIIHT